MIQHVYVAVDNSGLFGDAKVETASLGKVASFELGQILASCASRFRGLKDAHTDEVNRTAPQLA